MSGATTISVAESVRSGAVGEEAVALVIAWSANAPARVGEVVIFDKGSGALVLGRGGEGSGRVAFVRQRPSGSETMPPLQGNAISRDQLKLRPHPAGLTVERLGRCPTLVNGQRIDKCTLSPGDTLALRGQLVLVCVRRKTTISELQHFPERALGEFGEADAMGIIGESPCVWRHRDRIAFAAKAGTHVLIHGPSGAGKELAARGVHALSKRRDAALVARNAATLPPGLIDAGAVRQRQELPQSRHGRAPRADR